MMYIEKLDKKNVKLFYKKMEMPLEKFCDIFSTIQRKSFTIDLIKFDDFLHEEHEYKEENHGSISDFLIEFYGQEFCDFVESII